MKDLEIYHQIPRDSRQFLLTEAVSGLILIICMVFFFWNHWQGVEKANASSAHSTSVSSAKTTISTETAPLPRGCRTCKKEAEEEN
jgi:hypothetical protein